MMLYSKLAAGGIKRGARTYIPYILTCSCMIMVMYIISFLHTNPYIGESYGGSGMVMILTFGIWVMIIFSAIFLFYTNSFLIKRRKREFGLYNILGMGKLSIARIMVWETLIVYVVSTILGLGAGILLSKLAELFAVNMLNGEISYEFYVDIPSIIFTVICFAVIFTLILLNSLRQVHSAKPVELLHSESVGERPPKANWLVAVIGVLILAAAYYIAVTISDPVLAMAWFLVAVIMVIIATYLLFIAGSVALCAALKKNKGYYYKTNHFISVSQMSYRMKRNGAGLASICILSTMVLVTLSSTICLYAGAENFVQTICPRDIIISPRYAEEEFIEGFRETVNETLEKEGVTPANEMGYRYLEYRKNDESTFLEVYLIPEEDYNALMGKNLDLKDGEAAAYQTATPFTESEIELPGGLKYKIAETLSDFIPVGDEMRNIVSYLFLIVNNIEEAEKISPDKTDLTYYYGFDLPGVSDNRMIEIYETVKEALRGEGGYYDSVGYSGSMSSYCAANERRDVVPIYGGLFFLGIILGGVFILAAVLIMYYKQISEGYEDTKRFAILRGVGMTKREVNRAINSQVLTVFFLPLIASIIHTTFAFPLISKVLKLLGMTDTAFFAVVTLCCYLAFALLYVIVYFVTSRGYHKIVSGDKERI